MKIQTHHLAKEVGADCLHEPRLHLGVWLPPVTTVFQKLSEYRHQRSPSHVGCQDRCEEQVDELVRVGCPEVHKRGVLFGVLLLKVGLCTSSEALFVFSLQTTCFQDRGKVEQQILFQYGVSGKKVGVLVPDEEQKECQTGCGLAYHSQILSLPEVTEKAYLSTSSLCLTRISFKSSSSQNPWSLKFTRAD